MGKIRKFLVIAIISVIASVLINRFIQSQRYPILFKVYQTRDLSEKWLYKLLGVIPKEFINSYSFYDIENGNGYTLKKIQRVTEIPVEVGYILEVNNEAEFITAFLYSLIKNQNLKWISYENHLNYLFDVEVFNKYLRVSKVKDPKEIVDKLAYFFAEGGEFKKVESGLDLNLLKKYYEGIYKPIPDPELFLVKSKTLNFADFIYFWYPRMGLVQFEVDIKGDQVTKANLQIVGFMGLDYPPL
ncbi:hypothetical protein [Lunatibacter salilacus]|uniref:hypothetical protein n=1 Tax=Lunatibacter salilacus TaxID=2483804 RepID=UPI00131DAA88|nr:hypothetical protein [Lunatibacter salilacus]